MANPDCIFCKIIKRELPAAIVFENADVLAFEDIAPVAPIHYVFVPKKHHDSLAHIPDDQMSIMSSLFSAVCEVAKQEEIHEKGFRTVINTGLHGGQTVFHMHVHLMGGKSLNARMG